MMAEQHAVPAPLCGLRLLPGDTDTDTAPGTRGGTRPIAVPDAEVVSLSAAERSRLTVAHWAGTAANGAGQLWLHPGRMVHALWHGSPESMAEQYAYVRSREWVPPELGGKWAAAITIIGIAFHVLIGAPLGIVSRITGAAAKRPLRFLLLAAFLGAVFLILPNYL